MPSNMTPGSCKLCTAAAYFPSRNALIVHYADDHNASDQDIAQLMGYHIKSVRPKLIQARHAAGRSR